LSVGAEAVSTKALSGRGLPTDVGWVRSRDATSRNAINWQMRKRSFFARVLAFEADGDFGNRNQSSSLRMLWRWGSSFVDFLRGFCCSWRVVKGADPYQIGKNCTFTCRFFTFQPLASRALTHPTYVGSPLPERALEKIAFSSVDLSVGAETGSTAPVGACIARP